MVNTKEQFDDSFDSILMSVGRRPNTDKIGLEYTNAELDDRGFIKVDEYRRTNIDEIYAIGDITGDPMLAHKATHEGKVAAEVCTGIPRTFEPQVIPAVIFTDPEIAWAGPTEEELISKNI